MIPFRLNSVKEDKNGGERMSQSVFSEDMRLGKTLLSPQVCERQRVHAAACIPWKKCLRF